MAVALLVLAASSITSRAQSESADESTLATIPYTDPAFGFSLNIPAGWNYDRTRFRQFEDSIGLLRGRSPGGRHGLEIMVFRSFRMQPFEDWIVLFGKELAEMMQSTHVDWETVQIPPRAGAILTYTSKYGADQARTHYLCIPFDPHTVWVLVYRSVVYTAADEQRVRKEFDQITASLNVLYDPQEAERLAPALDRGKALIARLRANAERVRLDESEQYFQIVVADKPIGYLKRQATRDTYTYGDNNRRRGKSKEGIRVQEESWRFADDGTVRCTRLDAFSSFDLSSEVIGFKQIQYPAPDVKPQTPLIKTDQVVREGDTLFSSLTTSLDTSLPDPGKPMSVGPVYLDLVWSRLLPGLLLSSEREPHAFATYDTGTRALLAHRITPQPKANGAVRTGDAFVFEVRDGFVDQPSLLYTDERGNMLRMEIGDVVLKRATRATIEQAYRNRVAEVLGRFGG